MEEKDFLVNKIQEYSNFLTESKVKEVEFETINLSFLSNDEDLKLVTNGIKSKLEEIKNFPVLYWFTFSNSFNEHEVLYDFYINMIEQFKNKNYSKNKSDYSFRDGIDKLNYRRAFSAIKTKRNIDFNTNTLYVGKVESGIWGRLAVHLGWGTSPKTAGLQLLYWYDFEKYKDLTFNYIVFEKSMKYFVEVLEKELRNNLNPLIGKK